jgi:hypothetical protein
MTIEVGDPMAALLVVGVLLLIGWLVVYSAVRTATADRATAPVAIVASATSVGDRVGLSLFNTGARPAYDVHLATLDRQKVNWMGREIVVVPVLAPSVPIRVEIDRAALVTGHDDPLPGLLRVGWRKSWLSGARMSYDDAPLVVLDGPSGGSGA